MSAGLFVLLNDLLTFTAIWGNINNFFFCICSDARYMARDVQNTFYDIVEEFGKMDHALAVDYIKKLMTKGRYSQDVWS